MGLNDAGKIGIPVEPDFTGFAVDLEKHLKKVKASVEVDVKVDKNNLNKTKSTIDKTLGKVEVAVIPDVTKTAINKIKSEITKSIGTIPIAVKPTFTKTSLSEFKKELNRAINGSGSNTTAVQVKLELSNVAQKEIARVKRRLLDDIGVVRIPVATTIPGKTTGSIVSPTSIAQTEKFAASNRNLARDLTILGRAATEGKSSVFSFLGSISPTQVALTALGTGLIQATKSFIRFGIDSSKGIQQTDLALRSFLGGNQAATTAFIKQMQNFAAVSPFNLESVLKTSKLLLGAGQSVTKILPELKAIGGIGAQLGVSSDAISRVGLAIAKIAGQGKVTSRELRSIFTAFPGFQPIKALAENLEGFGGSTQKVLKAMSKGAINANDAISALIEGMLQFPGAASALYKQSLLLAGSQETLKDRFEQVARSSTGPALQQLALDYREAAEVFNQQSKTGLGGGIRSLIRDGGDLIPVLARGVVPLIDKFAGAIAAFLPPLKSFISEMGAPLFESFSAFLRLAPAAASGLTLFTNVITPLAPIITVFAKGLQLIPTPIIAIAGALKLLGATGGISGALAGTKSGKGRGLIGSLSPINLLKGVESGLGRVGDISTKTGSKIKGLFNAAGVEQYEKRIDSLSAKISKVGNSSALGGKGGLFAGILPEVSKVSLLADQLDKIEKKGVTTAQKITGSFKAMGSEIASAGSGLLSALGGPAGLAITAATVGAGALFERYQKVKAEAEQVRKETNLIGKELSLDSSANNGAERLVEIVHKLATETEVAAKNIAKLQKGFSGIDTSKLKGDLKDSLSGLQNGLSETQIAEFIGSKKKFDAATKQLESQAGDLRGSGGFLNINSAGAGFNRFLDGKFGLDFGNADSERALTATKKVYEEYLKTAKSTVAEELQISKELDQHGLVATFEQARVDLENGKDPAKVYDNIRGSVTKLSIAQAGLDDSALKAALSGKGLTDAMKKSTSATSAYNEAADELNTTLNELILNQDNISAATVTKNTDPVVLGRLSGQFASLGNDPEAQTKFLKDITAQVLEITNDPTAANAIVAQITGWKETAASALADFKKSFIDNMPQLSTIFADSFDINQGPGLSAIADRFTKSSDTVLQYTKNLAILQGTKYRDLAATFASQGLAGANAAAEAVIALNKNGTSKTLDELQKRVELYNTTIKAAGTSITETAKTYIGTQMGINPQLIVDPSLTINDPTQTDIDAAAARLNEISAGIQARRDELNKTNKNLKRHGEKGINVDDALANDPLYTGVLAEQARLQTFLDTAKKQIFTDLQTQAGTTATALNTTFSNAKIDEAIQPQIENISQSISVVPAQVNAALTEDPFAYIGSGIKVGTSLGQGVGIGFTQTMAAAKVIWNASFTSLGTELAGALTTSFTAGLKNLPNAILDPFRSTSIPLNSYLATLNTLATSLGLGKGLFPQIPKFHTGGIVGEKAETHSGKFTRDEQMAVLKKGEGVLPRSSMMKIGKGNFELLRKGVIGDGLGGNDEAKANYSSTSDRASIEAAKNSYFRQFSSGVAIRNIADAIVTFFANGANKYLDTLDAKIGSGLNIPGIISSGAVVDSLIANKGKSGSYRTLVQAMNGSSLPFKISSALRPGAITDSGNISLHSSGRAVDFVGSPAQMLQMAKWWTQYAPYLAELIHTPLGYGIKNGKVAQYPSNILAGHYNHGHVALYSGGLVKGTVAGTLATIGERGQSEAVLPFNQPKRMGEIISYAARNGYLNKAGQQAIAQALPQGNDNSRNVDVSGGINITIEGGAKDDELKAHVIGNRILSKMRGL